MAIGHKERIKEGQKPTPTRVRSKAQEDQVAKDLGGQRQPNSGATMWAPGDVVAGKFLVECKTKMTDSKSISIQKEWFEKNTKEAVKNAYQQKRDEFNDKLQQQREEAQQAHQQMIDAKNGLKNLKNLLK